MAVPSAAGKGLLGRVTLSGGRFSFWAILIGMATAIPSNSAIQTLITEAAQGDPAAKLRLQQLEDDNLRLQLEDYRTVSTDRGPVRGLR